MQACSRRAGQAAPATRRALLHAGNVGGDSSSALSRAASSLAIPVLCTIAAASRHHRRHITCVAGDGWPWPAGLSKLSSQQLVRARVIRGALIPFHII